MLIGTKCQSRVSVEVSAQQDVKFDRKSASEAVLISKNMKKSEKGPATAVLGNPLSVYFKNSVRSPE